MSHQDRRDPLPKGYQFGDARVRYETPEERLETTAFYRSNPYIWNVIEGESFASDAERHPITLGFDNRSGSRR